MSKYGVISGPCLPVFGLNTEIYGVNLHIHLEYRKIWTRNNSVFGHFSGSALLLLYAQIMKLSVSISIVNVNKSAALFTFTKEIFNEKPHVLDSVLSLLFINTLPMC